MSLTIVVPVFNSEKSLPLLIERLRSVLEPDSKKVEVLLVNDGSRDGSWFVIRRLVASYPWIRGINLMRNSGQHNALLCGIRAARYPVIVTPDDDLQTPPEENGQLPPFLAGGRDEVYGTRGHRHPRLLLPQPPAA